MVYKIESKGIQRVVVAKIDGKYLDIISRNNGRKFTIAFIENKTKKKIEFTMSVAEDNLCIIRFMVHRAADLFLIETIVETAVEVLEEILNKSQES